MIRTRALELRVDRAQVQEGYARRGVPSTSIFLTLTAGNQKGDHMRMGLLGTLGHVSELVSCMVSNNQRALLILTSQGSWIWVLITCREPTLSPTMIKLRGGKSKQQYTKCRYTTKECEKGGELK